MRAALTSFAKRAVLFAAVVALVLLVAALAGPSFGVVDYMAALRTKHERLSKLAPPRLVIIGGSNAAFGIDSERLERAFDMPVANMALHASLGYRFMANEVIHELGPGDVLLVIPEHSQFQAPDKAQDILYSALERYPAAWRYVPLGERPRIALTYAVRKLQLAVWAVIAPKQYKKDPVYRADGFTDRGDLVAHLHMPAPGVPDLTPMAADSIRVDPLFWDITEELEHRAAAVGARVLLAWPCQARSAAKASIDAGLLRDLHRQHITVVGEPQRYVYPDTLFFDSKYHLTGEGRELRTQQLINDLKGVL